MSTMTGDVVEIYVEDGRTMGRVSIRGAFVHVALMLLMEVRVGDQVLIDSGVAISTVSEDEVVVE